MTTTAVPIYQAALDRGLSIHPLHPRSKEPVLNGWQNQARSSADIMAAYPGHNYGVTACEQFCILDIDDLKTFRETICSELPETYTVQSSTPNKRHLYFRQTDASRALGNLKRPCFDFQQNTRYVVGEGSTHPDGPVYLGLSAAEIIPIPDDLVAALEKSTRTATGEKLPSAPDPTEGLVIGAGEGRHYFLTRAAGKLFDGEITEEEMLEKLNQLDEEHCFPPKGEGHNRQLVADAFRDWEPNKTNAVVICQRAQLTAETKAVSTPFDFVLGPQDGERHGVFAKGSLHLVAGSSGNGKSTLGIQMLKAQRAGEKFFGRATHSREYLIVWQDRTEGELIRQLDSMGMLNDPPPYVLVDSEEPPAKALKHIYEECQVKPEILFVEGIDLWCDDACEAKQVKPMARAVREVAVHYHLSIIGTLGQPKMKPKQGYANPRDRIIGSSVWGRLTDTILEVMVDDATDLREVQLIPRTGKRQRVTMAFKDGLLVLHEPSIPINITSVQPQSKTDVVFETLRQTEGSKEALMKAFPEMAESTARNWIAQYRKTLS